MKKWFKKANMENNEILEKEDLTQEENGEQVAETPENVNGAATQNAFEKENAELQKQVEELKDKYLRQAAEFENFKRRSVKEKIETIQTAARDTLSALLPILDDFERASKNEQFTEGVNFVHQKLVNTLSAKGLKAMDSPQGADFDPEFHEAITEIPAPTEALQGKIIDTVEKGYFLNDKIIRYAKVVVGK
jgi:molecular chaperone GrpE